VAAESDTRSGLGITPKALRWSREPGTRLQVMAIWTVVAVVCAISRAPFSRRVFEIVSGACLAFFLFPFIEGPFRLHAGSALPLRAEYRLVQGQPDRSTPSHRFGDLLGMGFQFAGELVQQADKRNIAVRAEIFRHEDNKDSAQLVEISSGLRTLPVMIFRSDFQDGFAFETSNAREAPLFPPDPECPIFRFPNMRSTRDLYRLHCKIKERFLDAHHPVLADNEGELARFIARSEVVHQRHAKCGDYQLAPLGEYYRTTWRGAIRQAWLLAWPIKQFRMMRMYSRAMKMAEDLGLRIHPKFGCLEDSLPHRERAKLPGARGQT
jgi:hypothetical protein